MPMVPSVAAAVAESYRRLRAYDDPALFISLKDEAAALAEAERHASSGAALPLLGCIIAVKDNIDVAGLPTTAACPAFSYQPARSAAVVAALEAAGAIVIGKTNLDQFATGLVGTRSPYGVPRNALRSDLIPGGSSSGSAVAVAAGIVDAALGTDTAGSGRIPAGMNGIVGLKPSLGLLSSRGVVPACRTLDTVSVFARSVQMALAITAIAAGFDPLDPYSRVLPQPVAAAVPPVLRVGVPLPGQLQFFGDDVGEAAFRHDIEALAALGADLVQVDIAPLLEAARLLYEGPWVAERYAATRALFDAEPAAFHPVTRAIIGGAAGLKTVDAFEAMYRLAELKRQAMPLFSRLDCLVVPTIPRFYTLAEIEADPIRLNSNLGTYTNFVNLLDLAAISVPVGRRTDGLPSSLTMVGRAGTDSHLAAIAAAAMAPATAGGSTLPVRAAPDRIEVAVVGAHLSGLPLNGELTALGASYVREAVTTPDYRLHALAGTVPAKPGMIRVAPGTGAAIALEVWSLDPPGFGRFVAGIPAPLGIGTLLLADGSRVKGFLCEPAGIEGARDISQFGGWRAYLAAIAGPALVSAG
jgi:allophanate hydrolase